MAADWLLHGVTMGCILILMSETGIENVTGAAGR